MLNPPTVSVIICAYTEDRWSLLGDCVASVEAQTAPPIEIVLCIDHNEEMLRRSEQHFGIGRPAGAIPLTVVANKYDGHLGSARNTAAEIASVKVPEKIDGISMLPTLLGRTQTNRHDFLYWEFHERGSQQAVRMGDWKAVRLGPGAPLELYNLSIDLSEKQNVAAQNPEVVAKIEAYLKIARTESEQWPIKAAEASPAKKQHEK